MVFCSGKMLRQDIYTSESSEPTLYTYGLRQYFSLSRSFRAYEDRILLTLSLSKRRTSVETLKVHFGRMRGFYGAPAVPIRTQLQVAKIVSDNIKRRGTI
jgi:hypothetical protein